MFPIKRLSLLIFILCSSHILFAATITIDSLSSQKQPRLSTIDSLKLELDAFVDDSLKAPVYTQIASEYLKYDTVKNKKQRHDYQNEAIKNTLSAIHYYSKYDDTTGLRASFDVLAKVYHAQHKYVQAKWFTIQSNSLSRATNDVRNIIASLIELSSIKTDIKDYTLAIRDLNEALAISTQNHIAPLESQVQLHYAMVYTVMKNYEKASVAMKRHDAIDNSIKRNNEARLMAKLKSADSLQQANKKEYIISNKKRYLKRIGLLSSL